MEETNGAHVVVCCAWGVLYVSEGHAFGSVDVLCGLGSGEAPHSLCYEARVLSLEAFLVSHKQSKVCFIASPEEIK